MGNLSTIIKEIIYQNDFLEDWLYNKYINTTWLALFIMPILKQKLEKENISLDAVKMAISREVKLLKVPNKEEKFNINSIFVKKWINIMFIENPSDYVNEINRIKKDKWKYLTKISWNTEVVLTFEDYYKNIIEKELAWIEIRKYEKNLALVWVNVAWQDMIDKPWIFYRISKWLYFYWIDVIQTIQTWKEISVVVKKDDLKEAFDVFCSI